MKANKSGYVVLSTSNHVNIVKLSLVQKLDLKFYEKVRFWYGSDIEVFSFFINHTKKTKNKFQRLFQKYKLSPSLFKKDIICDYIAFLGEIETTDTHVGIKDKMEAMDIA